MSEEPAKNWTLGEEARRHLYGNQCPHIPTGGKQRSGFACDACTQRLVEDVERAAMEQCAVICDRYGSSYFATKIRDAIRQPKT